MAWQWYHDTFEPGEVHLHALTGVIATRKTKYQTVEIVESEHYGKMLILDGDCQSSVKDEYIYHECLNEPAWYATRTRAGYLWSEAAKVRLCANCCASSRSSISTCATSTRKPISCMSSTCPVSYTHLRAHETRHDLVCRLLLE